MNGRRTLMAYLSICMGIFLYLGVGEKCLAAEELSVNKEMQFNTSGAGFTQDPVRIEEVMSSLLRMVVYDKNGNEAAYGSGFIAFDDHTLVTSAHVLEDMDYVLAYDEDETEYRFDDMYSYNEDDDVALCITETATQLPVLPVDTEYPKRGEKILAIASPLGLMNLVTDGIVSGLWHADETDRIIFTAAVSSGSSGGALFNDEGYVTGVVSGTYHEGQNLNLAVPIEKAKELYDMLQEEKEERESDREK